MSLKLKLILSFFVVILLTLFVGIWGVSGMRTMELNNMQSSMVSDGSAHLNSAQSEQMSYFLYGSAESVKNTKELLGEAKEHFQGVLNSLLADSPWRREVSTVLGKVDAMSAQFDKLLDLTNTLAKVDADYTDQGRNVVATLNELLEIAYQRQSQEFSLDSTRLVRQLTDVRAQLFEVRYNTWLLSTAPGQKNLDLVLGGIKKMEDLLRQTSSNFTRPDSHVVMERMLTELKGYEGFVNKSGKMGEQRQNMVGEAYRLASETIVQADTMTTGMKAELTKAISTLILQMVAVMVIAVFVGFLLAMLLTRNVIGLLGRDPGVLAALARRVSNGDYNIDDGKPRRGVYADFVAMVGALCENMDKARQESESARIATEDARASASLAEAAKLEAQNARREGMLQAAGKLEDVVGIVSSASEELSAQIEQSRHGAEQQAARVTETATAMEEMNSTVLEVARNAGSAADVSFSTRKKAEAGASIVGHAVDSIRQVRERSLQLKEDMNQLEESAQAINQIMNVISDIADQTNLLALNAAIEAARAGDAGRGFAVVADEVRNLAEKTMASTSDVANAIRAIQQSAALSRKQVDDAVVAIEEATDFARQSGDALKEIVELVDHTADQVRAIATASEQQSASSEEINESIAQVNGIAGETARAMDESAHAVAELAAQSQALSALIEEMKQS